MDATLAMAKEQRAMLREVLLMGVTRLVVDKGVIRATVKFDFKATEKIDRKDKAMVQDSSSWSNSVGHSGGFFGSLFGGGPQGGRPRAGGMRSSVWPPPRAQRTPRSQRNLTGFVDIQFKSDYFKLDNFATMYGPVAPGGLAPGGGPAPGAPAPPGPGGAAPPAVGPGQ